MTIRLGASTEVQLLWPTHIWSAPVDLSADDDFTRPEAARELLRPGLSKMLSHSGLTGADLLIRGEHLVLEEGSRLPVRASRADFCAWIWLGEEGEPETHESASVQLHDPRAGANLTLLPGLPWGRPGTLRPCPGTAVIWPGWLSWTLLPVGKNHRVEAIYLDVQVRASSSTQSVQGDLITL